MSYRVEFDNKFSNFLDSKIITDAILKLNDVHLELLEEHLSDKNSDDHSIELSLKLKDDNGDKYRIFIYNDGYHRYIDVCRCGDTLERTRAYVVERKKTVY